MDSVVLKCFIHFSISFRCCAFPNFCTPISRPLAYGVRISSKASPTADICHAVISCKGWSSRALISHYWSQYYPCRTFRRIRVLLNSREWAHQISVNEVMLLQIFHGGSDLSDHLGHLWRRQPGHTLTEIMQQTSCDEKSTTTIKYYVSSRCLSQVATQLQVKKCCWARQEN